MSWNDSKIALILFFIIILGLICLQVCQQKPTLPPPVPTPIIEMPTTPEPVPTPVIGPDINKMPECIYNELSESGYICRYNDDVLAKYFFKNGCFAYKDYNSPEVVK